MLDPTTLIEEIVIMLVLLGIFAVAAELITKGTEKFEGLLGQGMAGGIVLGFMASLPETIFVIVAATSGSYDVAIGAALGGNLILFSLGIGIIALACYMKWKKDVVLKEDYTIDITFLIISTLALIALFVYGKLDAISGSLLFVIYIVYIAYRYSKAHTRLVGHLKTQEGRKILLEGLALMVAGIILIIFFSGYFIHDIESVAGILTIPVILLSLIIIPVASDLEELIFGYRLSRGSPGGASTATVGFIGSKLENNTILVGIIGIIATTPIYIKSVATEFIAVIIINAVAIAIFSRGRFNYLQGMVLIVLYFIAIAAAFIV